MKMNKEIVMVRLSDIIPNRFQPRLTFDEEALNELAASIKEHGIIQPLILRDLGNKYEIIAGERRYKASQIAGVLEVPAIIGQMDDQTSAELALIENIQRKDLSAIEEAKSYKKILDMGGFTQDELAKRMGKGQSTIANKMRLLTLTNEVQAALMNNLISERHARCLLQIKDESKQKEVLNKIINERMNVRDTDNYIKNILNMNGEENASIGEPKVDIPIIPEIPNVEDRIDEQQNVQEEIVLPDTKEIKEANPNVYTQTNNIDFVDLNNLSFDNNDVHADTVPDAIDVIAPIEEEKSEEPALNVLDEIKINKEADNMPDKVLDANPIIENKEDNNQNNIAKIKMATAIRLAKDTLEDIKTAGYDASISEVDGQNSYQIIINIQK